MRRRHSLIFKVGTLLAIGLSVAWLVGLLAFITKIDGYPLPSPDALEQTDAIVVLTGGSERLATGLDLLRNGKAKKLFVSGVYPGLMIEHLAGGKNIDKDLRDCCIVLGHAAADTIGNAEETALWMQNEEFHSLRLVTANYHMPRSLLLFRDALPETMIIPHPVMPDSVRLQDWWSWPGTTSLLVTEYNKYLFASLRVSLRDFLEDLVEDLS